MGTILRLLNPNKEPQGETTIKNLSLNSRVEWDGLRAAGTLTIAELQSPQVTAKNISTPYRFADQILRLENLTTQVFGGTIAGSLTLALSAISDLSLQLRTLDLAQVAVASGATGASMRGTLTQGDFTARFDHKNFLPSATGTFSIEGAKGAFLGVNVFAEVLKAVGTIPTVDVALAKSVPPEFRAILESPDTEFDSLTARGSIDRGTVNLPTIGLQHQAYSIAGSGSATTAGDFDFRIQLRLAAPLIQGMLAREKNLKYLLDARGQLEIPVALRRSQGKVLVTPDVEKLLANAARAGAKDAAGKVLEKVAPGLGGASKLLDQFFQ